MSLNRKVGNKVKVRRILYVHGMGGGGSSRIPSILKEYFSSSNFGKTYGEVSVDVIIETYQFNPILGHVQITHRVEKYAPDLVIGESLGSIHAIGVRGVPHLLVSPSLNAPLYFSRLAFLSKIPGVSSYLAHKFKPREGDRQELCFIYKNMHPWEYFRKEALANSPLAGSTDYFYAFFGTKDHYRKTGVVSIRTYEKYFGQNYDIYQGTHFMEEEYIHSMLIPKIKEVLKIS